MTIIVETIFVGRLEAMIAEVATLDPRGDYMTNAECAWAVQPVGQDQHDAEYCRTKKEAIECARDLARVYNCKIAAV